MIRYTVVEDEEPARLRLKRLMDQLRPGSVCLGEAEDGDGGLRLVRDLRPDVCFLDIEFPPGGAFGLLAKAREQAIELPPLVFVTAFDRHAVEAFRWSAVDYLLKPLDRGLLEESLKRVEARTLAAPELGDLLQALQAVRKDEAPARFTLLWKGRLKVFSWKDVSHLTTENRLLLVHTPEGRYPLDRTLDELEKLLAPGFYRCHRGAMVALDRVRELVADAGGTGELKLEGGERVAVSRDRMAELRRRLG